MKRSLVLLTFGVLILSALPARADICNGEACGHWYHPKGDVLIGPSTMTWTNGLNDDCAVFAQDHHVTILDCTEYKAKQPQHKWEMYYFLQALGDDLHIRKSTEIPSCIARRSCWPDDTGMNLERLSEPRTR